MLSRALSGEDLRREEKDFDLGKLRKKGLPISTAIQRKDFNKHSGTRWAKRKANLRAKDHQDKMFVSRPGFSQDEGSDYVRAMVDARNAAGSAISGVMADAERDNTELAWRNQMQRMQDQQFTNNLGIIQNRQRTRDQLDQGIRNNLERLRIASNRNKMQLRQALMDAQMGYLSNFTNMFGDMFGGGGGGGMFGGFGGGDDWSLLDMANNPYG